MNDAHSTLVNLAGYVDGGLAAWLRQHSTLSARLAECPIDTGKFLL